MMSVVCKTSRGCVLDHEGYISNCYKKTNSDEIYKPQKWMFDLKTPFRMQKQAEKMADAYENRKDFLPSSRKRKSRKCQAPLPHHEELSQMSSELLAIAREKRYFLNSVTTEDLKENNMRARRKAMEILNQPLQGDFYGANDTNSVQKVDQKGSLTVVLPPHCRFFNKDITQISETLNPSKEKFDLIVMDPPWENKFIRRVKHRKGYATLSADQIMSLPIGDLLSTRGCVAIWCTNNENLLEFVKSEMLPSWGLQLHGEWHWMKVTKSGEFVTDLNSQHEKRPYEKLLIAINTNADVQDFPRDYVIISVPSMIHSHKPPVTEVLKTWLPSSPSCLELFSRYLLPGYTSWGNQVLLLQDIALFDKEKVS